jgi:hypothetical protein
MIGVTASMCLVAVPVASAQEQEDLELMQTFLAIMTDYFEIIESTHAVSSDPEKAAIMQMQKIQEVYEQRGEEAGFGRQQQSYDTQCRVHAARRYAERHGAGGRGAADVAPGARREH